MSRGLRTRFKAALWARGIEVRRRGGGVRRTVEELMDHVNRMGFQPATVIDVGVAYGTPELYQAFPRARHLLIEPLEEYAEALGRIAREHGAEFVLAAAGSEAGTTTINVHRAPALSSTLGAWQGAGGQTNAREVPVVRVDDVVAERGLPGPYVLKVDVEGGELGVLGGAPRVLEGAELVLLESYLFELLPGAPLLHDVTAYMAERGFVVYELYGGDVRPLDGALALVNVAFVRRDGFFRADQSYATPEQFERLVRSWGY
ncbi:MAG TPA: FkbM family methyltransferase [Thermoleophilaceae bacterium]